MGDVIQIGDEGVVSFEFSRGQDKIVIPLDVVLIHDEWVGMDQQFYGPDGQFVKGKDAEQREATFAFVRGIIASWADAASRANGDGGSVTASAQRIMEGLNYTQILRFRKQLRTQVEKMKGFFSDETGSVQSPPPPSGTVVYSE